MINKVILLGRVGAEPKIFSQQNGEEIASFSLATSEHWKDKQTGEKKERAEWHKIVAFSPPLVNILKRYVKKGKQIYIEGVLQSRKWQGKDGKDNYTTEIVLKGSGIIKLLDNEKE